MGKNARKRASARLSKETDQSGYSSPPIRVGILAVHGIGRQAQGAMAQDVFGSLTRAVEEIGGEVLSLAKESTGSKTTGKDSRLGAWVRVPNEAPRLVFVEEAWWDERVNHAKAWKIFARLFLNLPMFVMESSALWAARHLSFEESKKIQFDGNSISLIGLVRQIIALWGPFTAVMIAYVLSPLLVLLLVAALPIYFFVLVLRSMGSQRAERVVDLIRVVIVETIGDIWAYVDPVTGNEILQFVVKRHKQMRAVYDEVLLVGHSQGADLARRACLEGTPPEAYVAVGSGHHQLLGARTSSANFWLLPVLWLFPAVMPLFMWWHTSLSVSALGKMVAQVLTDLLSIIKYGEVADPWALVRLSIRDAPAMIVMIGGFVVWFFITGMIRRPADALESPPCPAWIIRSPWDPVSLGTESAEESVRTVTPGPSQMLLREHVTYWEKPESGNTLLEAIYRSGRIVPMGDLQLRMSGRVRLLWSAAGISAMIVIWKIGEWEATGVRQLFPG